MEVLRCRRWLAYLHVVARAELQIALNASAGVLWSLAFHAVRQQHSDARQQSPLLFAGGDELVDDDLAAVCEIAKLRLPHHQSLRKVAAESVLEAEHRLFGEFRVVDFHP